MSRSRSRMWMGPRNYERWVPAPKTNADFSAIGIREQDQYLNGGSGVRGSKDTHKEYNFAWTSTRREELAPVLDVASGIYDSGLSADLVYFVDPTVYDWNVLPAMLAAPYKTGLDGVPLLRDADGYPIYPDVDQSPYNTRGYPARAATYALSAATTPRTVYIPIPPGKTLWIGAHGTGSGAGLAVTPYNGGAEMDAEFPPLLSVETDVRVNASWSRDGDGVTGVEIGIDRTPGSTTGTVTLQGVIGQILDDGVTPFPGDFISGQGNAGCDFSSMPTLSPYRGGKFWSVTAKLTEVGSWQ